MAINFRRGLIGLAVLFSVTSQAESPQITLQSTRSMTQAMQERAQVCDRIRANPHCSGVEGLLQNATGLTTSTCRADLQAKHCDRFFARFPKYQNHAMSCEPYDICKLSLEATMAEGCKRYGIEVKDTFMSFLSSEVSCLTQWQCLARQSFSNAVNFLMPGRLASQAADATIQSFREDRAKLERASCLDAETQAQLYCYLGVKYGGMALGAAGAARAAGAGLMARMATLETELVSADTAVAARASVPTVRAAAGALNAETKALADYLAANPEIEMHLGTTGGKGVLTIGYISNESPRLSALIARAVRSGGISSIDAGRVVGPKVLNLLTRVRDVATGEVRITGVMDPKLVDKNAFREIAESRAGRANEVAGHWSDSDVANFQQARRTLRIDEACDRFYVGDCGPMHFSFDARHPEQIQWSR